MKNYFYFSGRIASSQTQISVCEENGAPRRGGRSAGLRGPGRGGVLTRVFLAGGAPGLIKNLPPDAQGAVT